MILAIVTFNLPRPVALAEISATFQSTAPRYLKLPGLLRKNYFVSEDGRRAGGVYVWESRAQAQAVYSPEWQATVKAKYGADPDIVFLESPVMVDNGAGTIRVG
ncbi:MAG: YdhR family protein [Burkholderiales bacterium]|nr:YdhR family protein [Burkholderiales bacterium]